MMMEGAWVPDDHGATVPTLDCFSLDLCHAYRNNPVYISVTGVFYYMQL